MKYIISPFFDTSLRRILPHLQAGCLFFLASLLIAPTFWYGHPCGHDTVTHFWRAVMVGENTAVGQPFLGWGEHFLRGYGYPIFLFYAPAFNWLVTLIHQFGLDYSPAMRLLTWLAFPVAGWGAYTLGRRYLPPTAALVTGFAYLFAPYLLYDGIQRGAIPELLGLALLPWVLFLFERAFAQPTRRAVALAAGSLALLMLSHNIIPMFAIACGLGLGVARGIAQFGKASGRSTRTGWAHSIGVAGLIVGVGLSLSAFFWLPALIELGDTQTGLAESPFDAWPRWYQHFIPLDELVGLPPEPADFSLGNPAEALKLGWPQVVLAGFGLLGLMWGLIFSKPASSHRASLLMWGAIGLTSLFLAQASSSWLWELWPLPALVQLPSRFLGPLSLSTAVLAGTSLTYLPQPKHLSAGTAISASLLIAVAGFPWLYPLYCPLPSQPTAADIAQASVWNEAGEVAAWGGPSLGEALPRWVAQLPPPDQHVAAYEAGQAVQRLTLPPGGELQRWHTAVSGDQYIIALDEPATLTYHAFYLPHWQLERNGQPWPLTPAPETGLLQFDLPAGTSELSLRFRPTPLRYATALFSLLTLLGLLALTAFAPPVSSPQSPNRPDAPHLTNRLTWRTTAVLLLLLAGAKTMTDLTNNPLRADRYQVETGRLLMVDHPTNIAFGDQFEHLGYNAPASLPADGTADITQYWTPLTNPGVPFGFDVRLADTAGNVWSLPPTRPFGYVAIPGQRGWVQGEYMRDAYQLRLLPGTPPGIYWLETTAFRRDTPFALTPQNGATAPDPAWARLGEIRVTTAGTTPRLTESTTAVVDTFAPHPLSPSLTLLGHTLTDTFGRPADALWLSLLWQATAVPVAPTEVVLSLVNVSEEGAEEERHTAVVTYTHAVGQQYPTPNWSADSVVRDQLTLILPRELSTGMYQLLLEGHPLGQIRVEAPEHHFSPPPNITELSQPTAEFGFARLHGFTLSAPQPEPGQPLTVALIWQATATTEKNYRVFVHLRETTTGAIVHQSDAEPGAWGRPTRGWLKGEYILETHTLPIRSDLPPGSYTLVVGLYDPLTGDRLGEVILE